MKKNLLLTTLFSILFFSLQAQLVVIVGANENNPDGFAFAATQNIPGGTVVYFTTDEYSDAANAFDNNQGNTNLNQAEDLISWTAPAGGVNEGEVIVFSESSSNTFTLTCSSGTCGTGTFVGGVGFNFGGTDELYAFSDNDANHLNGITEIYMGIQSNGSLTADEDPSNDFPNAVVLNVTSTIGWFEYNGDRTASTDPADLGDLSSFTVSGTGNTTLSTTSFSGGFVVLPIELTSFRADVKNSQEVLLTWQTASEINSDYVLVERSKDGYQYESLGRVNSFGTTNIQQNYNFLDKSPFKGINYYRLRQVDNDGQEEVHQVVSVNIDREISSTIYPNPGKDNVTLSINEALETDGLLSFYDLTGRLIIQQVVPANTQKMNLATEHLPSGATYLLRLEGGNFVENIRFVKR